MNKKVKIRVSNREISRVTGTDFPRGFLPDFITLEGELVEEPKINQTNTWHEPRSIFPKPKPVEEPATAGDENKGGPCHDGVNYHEACTFKSCVCLCHRPQSEKREEHPWNDIFFGKNLPVLPEPLKTGVEGGPVFELENKLNELLAYLKQRDS